MVLESQGLASLQLKAGECPLERFGRPVALRHEGVGALTQLSRASARQQLKRLAIFSRQFDRLRLSSSTHAPKLSSTLFIMKAS